MQGFEESDERPSLVDQPLSADGVAPTLSAAEWAVLNYGQVDLGDSRRNRRAVQMATRMAAHAEDSLPKQMQDHNQLIRAYGLLGQSDVSLAELLSPHTHHTLDLARQTNVVLMIEDTSELDFTSHPTMTGLGPIGDGHGRGLLLHDTLAIEPTSRQVLGLACLQVVLRVAKTKPRMDKYSDSAEAHLWLNSARTVGRPAGGTTWVHVSDRGSDTLEYMIECLNQGKHFLIRAKHNRNLLQEPSQDQIRDAQAPPANPDNPESVGPLDESGAPTYLLDFARALPTCPGVERELKIPARDKRPTRTAKLGFAWAKVTIKMPLQAPILTREHAPIDLWVLRVFEPLPPSEGKPIEWVLLSSLPIDCAECAFATAERYSCRWLCEDFHMCLKTGCKIEQSHFDSAQDIERLLGFKAPLAIRLLELRDLARNTPSVAAKSVVEPLMVAVLARRVGKLSSTRPLSFEMTLGDFWAGVARLGGHLGRKGDGNPGWRAIWSGWHYLATLTDGARIGATDPIVHTISQTHQPLHSDY